MAVTRQGRPRDPLHAELLRRHFMLAGPETDRRGRFSRERRSGEDRRREPAGMAAVPGLDRRRGDRRQRARRATDSSSVGSLAALLLV